jgi:hypothetical protein
MFSVVSSVSDCATCVIALMNSEVNAEVGGALLLSSSNTVVLIVFDRS